MAIFLNVLAILVVVIAIIVCFFKNLNINLNIKISQEFNESDRQLLQDLYDKDGELKDKDEQATLDDIVQAVNSIMTDVEDN